jgi:histidine triad (HIT) family protein
MEDSIFTKIIKGEIPSHKIYEDETTIAFLDINPANEGHTLVVPKAQVEFVWDLTQADYDGLMQSVRKVALRLRSVYGSYVSEVVVGVDVPHAHIHLIPFIESTELKNIFTSTNGEPDHEQLAKVAEKLSF